MGWAGGSELMNKCIAVIQKEVPDAEARQRIYSVMIQAFDREDWDTHDESMGTDPAFDAAMNDIDEDAR